MKPRKTLLCAIATFAVLAGPAESPAGIKCWTNDEGVRECGNAVPPEYAQQGHREMSEQGITIKRTKSEEELRKEREERERIAAIEAEKERARKKRAAHDRVLLSTFTTEEDLLLARDGQIAAIDSRIQHTEQIVRQLEASLAELHGKAATLERSGKPVTDELRAKIAHVKNQIAESHAYIRERRKRKAEVAEQFAADLVRYRELKGTTN